MSFFHLTYCFLLPILGTGPVLLDDNSAPPDFVLTMTDGAQGIGSVEQINDNWSVRLIGAKPINATGLQVVSLRRDKTQLPPPPQGEQVILVNGDRIPGKIQELTNDRLHAQIDLGKEIDFVLPLSAVAIIWG